MHEDDPFEDPGTPTLGSIADDGRDYSRFGVTTLVVGGVRGGVTSSG